MKDHTLNYVLTPYFDIYVLFKFEVECLLRKNLYDRNMMSDSYYQVSLVCNIVAVTPVCEMYISRLMPDSRTFIFLGLPS